VVVVVGGASFFAFLAFVTSHCSGFDGGAPLATLIEGFERTHL
jgi:hypothetical protein